MIELLRTNDPVLLSWLESLLQGDGIEVLVLDRFTSYAEGSIGAIQCRLMVAAEDYDRARRLIDTAGHGDILGRAGR